MSSVLPPTLAFSPRDSTDESCSSSPAQDPNLMPFNIDYTGPANIDGYMVIHKSDNGAEYSHFRGRRLYNTRLSLPDGWEGNVYNIQRNQEVVQPAPSTSSQSASAQAERAQLLRMKKRRKIETKAAPKKAAMKSFSMDDDDEDEDEGADVVEQDDGDDDGSMPDSYLDEEEADTTTISPPPPQDSTNHQNTSQTTTLTPTRTPFTSLNIWNPDGPLDMGDEELVKILGEWNQIRTLLHTR